MDLKIVGIISRKTKSVAGSLSGLLLSNSRAPMASFLRFSSHSRAIGNLFVNIGHSDSPFLSAYSNLYTESRWHSSETLVK